jgi:hypothetical protein
MGYPNGQIPSTALRSIGHGDELLAPTANAYKSLVLLGSVLGWDIRPASGVGSGYRSIQVQKEYWDAAHGNSADQRLVGLSSRSTVNVASPGTSSHGDGQKVDLVFNGSDMPSADQIALANHCGFVRQFGANDPNHFAHDGRTMTGGPGQADKNRILAHYYNSRGLGRTTSTQQDGVFDKTKEQNFTWLVQEAGIKDGLYKVPPYIHDGIWGPHTDSVNTHYWNAIWSTL